MIDLEHSPMGGSSAKRVLNCSGSFLLTRLLMLQDQFEGSPPSIYADEGVAAHELGAMCLVEQKEPYEFIGQKIGTYTVMSGDLDPDAVSIYVNTCNAIVDACPSNGVSIVEQTFSIPELHPLFKGTVDFAHWRINWVDLGEIFTPDSGLWLIDYKNGEGIGVSPVRLEQLQYYAFLLISKFTELQMVPGNFPVHLGIVQPNYFGKFEEPEFWETTIDEIVTWGTEILLPEMWRLWDDHREELSDDDFQPGEHCQFCPVMLECPKAKAAFDLHAYGEEWELPMLTDEELSERYAARDLARKYGNELEKVVFARKIAGKVIASAKLVEKQVRRVWRPGADEAAKAKFGPAALAPAKTKSPAQLEKLSSEGKAFAQEWGFKPISDRLTIAPVSDRRPEVKPPSNSEIFKNFATDEIDVSTLAW